MATVYRMPGPGEDPGPEAPPGDDGEQPRGPSFLERTLTARAFCLIDRPEPVPLLGPLIYRGGRTVIAGGTGDGKSTFGYQAVAATVYGREFIGYQGVGGVRALILDAEQDGYTAADALRRAGLADSEDVDILHIPEGAEVADLLHERRWMEEVLERGQYALVDADPLYKLHRADSSSERDAVKLMSLFDKWRMAQDCPWEPFGLLMPMHARKPPPKTKFTMAEIFGSTAWVRGAEVVMGIQQVNHGYSMLYPWKKRNRIGDVEGVTFQKGDTIGLVYDDKHLFRRGAGRPKETADEQVRRLVLEERQLEGWTVEMLCEAVKGRGGGSASRTTIDRALKNMGKSVEKRTGPDGVGTFHVTHQGRLDLLDPPDEAELDRYEGMARP
jgi:hypothetical protein